MNATLQSPSLSSELRALIDRRNILTSRTKSRVLRDLDKQIYLDKEYKHTKLRLRALEEIFTSEESYLKQLEITMKFFKNPLNDSKCVLPNVLKSVFDNLESVYNVNGELLNQLRQHGDDVATAFRNVAPFFKLYSVYAYDYRHGLNVLQDLPKTNPKLDAFIKKQETRPEVNTKLCSLLIAPIQRIPRYRLLLKELLSHTSKTHEHYYSLQEALREVELSTEHINSLVQEQESMQRLIELQKSLCGGKPTLVCPGRKLIKEGFLMKVSKNGKKAHPRYFVLMSDILMYCKPMNSILGEANSLSCSCVLPLRKSHVHHVLGDKVFNVTCHTFSLILYSDEPSCSEGWISAIQDAINQEQEDRQTLHRRGSARQALRKKDFNLMSETLTPRKRKQNQTDLDDICLPFHSPWKKNRRNSTSSNSKGNKDTVIASSVPAAVKTVTNRPGYFSSFKKAILNIGHSFQKYLLPIYTGRENIDRCLTDVPH